MKHYKTSFKGEKSLDEIQSAVGRGGGLLTRVHMDRGETHVYYASDAEGHGKHLGDLGAGPPSEVRESEVSKL
jgi:hypothetical protein